MNGSYRLELTPDDNDTFLATCPALPKVTSFGASREEAIANGRLALEKAIAARLADSGYSTSSTRRDSTRSRQRSRRSEDRWR